MYAAKGPTSNNSNSHGGAGSGNALTDSGSILAREKLAMHVYEYLLQSGAPKAAQTFLNEIRWEKSVQLGDQPGFLQSWWGVFWDLYSAAPERRDTQEHSSEAKTFHDYGMANQLPYIPGSGIHPNTTPSPVPSMPPHEQLIGGSGGPMQPGTPYYSSFPPRYTSPRMRIANGFNNGPGPMPMHSGMPEMRGAMSPTVRPAHRMSIPHQHQYPMRGPHLLNGVNHGPPAQHMSHVPPMPMAGHPGNRQWAPVNHTQQLTFNSSPPNSYSAHPGIGTPGTPIMSSPHGSTSSASDNKTKDSVHSNEVYGMMSRPPMHGNGPYGLTTEHMLPMPHELSHHHHHHASNGTSPGEMLDGVKSSPVHSNCTAPQTPLRGDELGPPASMTPGLSNELSVGNNGAYMAGQYQQQHESSEAASDAIMKIKESMQAEAKLFEKEDSSQSQTEFYMNS